jgi:hypothetical protein
MAVQWPHERSPEGNGAETGVDRAAVNRVACLEPVIGGTSLSYTSVRKCHRPQAPAEADAFN